MLPSGTWQFRNGEQNTVIFSPGGERFVVAHSYLTGISCEELERIRWKNSGTDHHANIRPSRLREYIEGNLL